MIKLKGKTKMQFRASLDIQTQAILYYLILYNYYKCTYYVY